MKKILEIGLLTGVAVSMLVPGIRNIEKNNTSEFQSVYMINEDTSRAFKYLQVDSFYLPIIPPSSGVQFYKDNIIFLSPSKHNSKMVEKHVSFGTNQAFVTSPEDPFLGKSTLFSPSSTFNYPCEGLTFESDFNTMYYTKLYGSDKKEKIFQAKYSLNNKGQSDWDWELNPLNFCTENIKYSHPSLSNDGQILVFTSDKESSDGNMDIYFSRKKVDIWSDPEKFGDSINTPGNELFPFLDSENNLFFSSDGLSGYGGLDIFTCKFNGVSWNKPINLTDRINSELDDIAFVINKSDGKIAFYTKKGKSDKDKMQLFRVTINKEAPDSIPLTMSYVFNGKPELKPFIVTEEVTTKVKSDTIIQPPAKEEAIIPETVVIKSEPLLKQPEVKSVIIKPTIPTPVEYIDVVIYRIQFRSSVKPQKDSFVTINGESYKTYEYYYLGEYRYTIGEFTTLAPATELQNICRKSGYPQAFVAAFKNNLRSMDLKLFK
jgi:hypothetical protein